MSVLAFRVRNFMGFIDSGWIALPPICLLFGRNSSGKSALIKALRMLQQSLESDPNKEPLILFSERGVDLGSYWDVVHAHDTNLEIQFSFHCQIQPHMLLEFKSPTERLRARLEGEPVISEKESRASLHLRFGPAGPGVRKVPLTAVGISVRWNQEESEDERPVFYAEWLGEEEGWWFDPDFLKDSHATWAKVLSLSARQSFLPWLPELGHSEEEEIDNIYYLIKALLSEFKEILTSFLESIVYLGPTRLEPSRFYYVPSGSTRAASSDGGSSIQTYLASWGKPEWRALEKSINKSLATLDLGLCIQSRPLQSGRGAYEPLFEVLVIEIADTDVSTNVHDVGFGISQVLPIILEIVLARQGTTIIVEQPELHLHPRAQAALGDLFIVATNSGVKLLVETHSEHLLLRLRRRIAETTSGQLADMPDRHLYSKDVAVYFVDRRDGRSSSERVMLDHRGSIGTLPPTLKNFFSDDIIEVLKLTDATFRIQEQ